MSLNHLMMELQGRKPTDDELRRLYVIAKHLGVNPDDDAIMALYAALEWYNGIFSTIPDKISSASENAANAAISRINANATQLKNSFDDYAKQSASKAVAGMVDAVRQTANKTAATNNIKWIAICSLVLTIILSTVGIFGATKIYNTAFDKGFQSGVADAANTELLLKKRDQFQKSDLYGLVVAYDEAGLLEDILKCKRKGWHVDNGECVPGSFKIENKKGDYTLPWKMPEIQ